MLRKMVYFLKFVPRPVNFIALLMVVTNLLSGCDVGNLQISKLINLSMFQTSSDQTNIGVPEQEIGRELVKDYGPFNPVGRCWLTKSPFGNNSDNYCVNIDHIELVPNLTNPTYYVTVLGKLVDDRFQEAGCHSCPGLVGLYVLEKDIDQQMHVLSKNSFIQSGSWGAPSSQIDIKKIGANQLAWFIVDGGMYQGETFGAIEIFASHGAKVKSILSMITSRSYSRDEKYIADRSACDPYDAWDIDLQVDLTSTKPYFPLIAKLSSELCPTKYINETFNLQFNQQSSRYLIPRQLKKMVEIPND